jgi:hypothetical protein
MDLLKIKGFASFPVQSGKRRELHAPAWIMSGEGPIGSKRE